MSTSDLGLRIVDTLTDLFERGKLTCAQYQEQLASILAAAHDRWHAAESSLSPSGDRESPLGDRESPLSPKISAFTILLPRPKAKERNIRAESMSPKDVPVEKLKRAGVVEKVGRQVPTKSAKQERCARQVVSEKKVVPEVGVSVTQGKKGKRVQERDQGVIILGVEVRATKGKIEHVAVKSTDMEGDRSEEKGKRLQSSTGSKQMSTGGGKEALVLPLPRPRIPVPKGADYSKMGTQVPIKNANSSRQEDPVKQEATVKRAVVVEKVGQPVPTKSVKHERCARQDVSEKKVVPGVGVSATKEEDGVKMPVIPKGEIGPDEDLSTFRQIQWESVCFMDRYGDSYTCGSCWRRVHVRCVGSPCEGCGYTLGEVPGRNVQMEKVNPIKVDVHVETRANYDMEIWLEDIDMNGITRCGRCDSRFLAEVGYCEMCEEEEEAAVCAAQPRLSCNTLEAIPGLPFVARDTVTGLLHVKLEPIYEMDDAFNEFIRCFESLPPEAPKVNASNLKVSLESIVQWFLCQRKLNEKLFVGQPPSYLTPFGGSPVTASSWACCQNFGVFVGRNLTVRVVCVTETPPYQKQTVGRRPVYYGRDCALINRLWICLWRCYHRSTGVFRAWDNWVRSFFLIATLSHCPRVMQFECEGCAEGWHVKERELLGSRRKCQRGEHVRVFPSVDMVRWWQGWLSHAEYSGGGERTEGYEPDYEYGGIFVAYCPQCSPKFQAEVSVRHCVQERWYAYARVDWPDQRGRVKYNTLKKSRKREVQKAIKKYKVGWDKEYEELSKEREECRKAYWREQQMVEASYQSYHYQVEEEWDDEVMPFC